MASPISLATAERRARQLLVEYLTGHARVQRLLRWFGQLSWELAEAETSPLGLRELADEVQLSLDEYTGSYRTDEELQKLLREALSRYWLSLEMATTPARIVRTTSQSRSSVLELAFG